MAKLVAVTACPTGIAHTIMAAEALQQAADRTGHSIQVETQGSAGTRNTLSSADIAAADAVIIAADTQVSTERFAGKNLLEVGTVAACIGGAPCISTGGAIKNKPTTGTCCDTWPLM